VRIKVPCPVRKASLLGLRDLTTAYLLSGIEPAAAQSGHPP
jgi:hypothetical protein